jgi:hypothetical protein
MKVDPLFPTYTCHRRFKTFVSLTKGRMTLSKTIKMPHAKQNCVIMQSVVLLLIH